jgi:hypothetical protein
MYTYGYHTLLILAKLTTVDCWEVDGLYPATEVTGISPSFPLKLENIQFGLKRQIQQKIPVF